MTVGEKKYATIYSRRGKIFVLSQHEVPSGAMYRQDDPISVSVDDVVGIALAIRKQLDAFRVLASFPANWMAVIEGKSGDGSSNLISAAGVKSFVTFRRGARMVSVKLEGGQIEFCPSRQIRGGFEYLPDSRKTIASDRANREIGELAITSLNDSE